ncbi:MAG: M10 family metallopeptidase C-terminal domain-containing protein [Acetobacteraceae bacterium]|nr:M10 family metallopeptidase C-terminal domain-containing protein [Acetobacteraceae bacterium]
MTLRTVGLHSQFASIAQAMAAAGPGDTIQLESGYSHETATVRFSGMTIFGGAHSRDIVLNLGMGIATVTLTGTANIHLNDATDGNGIVGNAGNNVITVTGGIDAVDGGLGVDRLVVDYREAIGAITGDSTSNFSEAGGGGRSVTMTDGTIEHFTVLTGSGADTITTGAGNDIIKTGQGASTVSAGQGANIIIGGGNADTITALGGGNLVRAGNGTNTVTTGAGADLIFSGRGSDTITAGGGADHITLHGGADSVEAGAGHDRLFLNYAALLTNVSGGIAGGNGKTGYVGHIADLAGSIVDFQRVESFTIKSGSGDDTITTGNGADVLRGNDGRDVFRAGGGQDQLFGGNGRDVLHGGTGADELTGGYGADVFVFATLGEAGAGRTHDMIRDFKSGVDHINLSGIDADVTLIATGDQAFHFIGGAQFHAVAGELRYSGGMVRGDVDGDGVGDFSIEVGVVPALNQHDFFL